MTGSIEGTASLQLSLHESSATFEASSAFVVDTLELVFFSDASMFGLSDGAIEVVLGK